MGKSLKTRRIKATEKVRVLKDQYGVVKTPKMLGMCRVTMYRRLKSGNWKITELSLIESL